jgi:hypothetical protein
MYFGVRFRRMETSLRLDMPKAVEDKLKAVARAKGYGKKRSNALVYGTMRRLGWKPEREKK